MAYDSARGRVVLFGGYSDASGYFADTWEWDGTAWQNRTPAVSPPARNLHAMAYDSWRGRVVLFGGHNPSGYLSDTWEWDGIGWVERVVAAGPIGRAGHALAYDSVRGRVVLFGGFPASGGALADTWEWDGAVWLNVSPAVSPSIRAWHSMAYDIAHGCTVLFGGQVGGGWSDETWEWDGTVWQNVSPSVSPPARRAHAIAYDIGIGRMVLFGGSASSGIEADTWEWDGTSWANITPRVSPPARYIHAMAYDSTRDRVVLFGGWNDGRSFEDTWEYGGPIETTCDGMDDNGNGLIDEGCDDDSDGYCDATMTVVGTPTSCQGGGGDCNDEAAAIHPAATEICNGLDEDCDGSTDEDLGVTTCGIGACAVTIQNCANGVPQTCTPGMPSVEICDNVDNDCDGVIDGAGAHCPLYVDDDAPGDPGPNDPNVSDPLEDGSQAHPFDSVQEALDVCTGPDTTHVLPGTYNEDLVVRNDGCQILGSGKAITTIRSVSGTALLAETSGEMNLVARDLALEQGSFTSLGHLKLSLSDVEMRSGRISIGVPNDCAYVEASQVTLERITMDSGDISLSTSCSGSEAPGFALTSIFAPMSALYFTVSVGSTAQLSLSDCDLRTFSVASYEDAGFLGITIDRCRFTGGPGAHSNMMVRSTVVIHDTVFEDQIVDIGSGITDFVGLDISLAKTVFSRASIHAFPRTSMNGSWVLNIESCRFVQGGLRVSAPNATAERIITGVSVTNSTFEQCGTAAQVEVAYDPPPEDPNTPVELHWSAGFAFANNTMMTCDTGLTFSVLAGEPWPADELKVSISNNIVASNKVGIRFTRPVGADVTVANNDVFGNTLGNYRGDISNQTGLNGNISADPWFRGPLDGDFGLLPSSPCIDRGGVGPGIPVADLDGVRRPLDGDGDGFSLPDIGALEFIRDADGDGVSDDGDLSGVGGDSQCVCGAAAACDDNCRLTLNSDQHDSDCDGVGDACDVSPLVYNPGQEDQDGDSVGDVSDGCPSSYNPTQFDIDGDGVQDACDPPACGNGVLEPGETCDDGNVVPGDGCAENCRLALEIGASGADRTVLGDSGSDLLGNSLAAGDVNGDGKADLIIGAPTFDPPGGGRVNAGGVFVVLGASSYADVDLNSQPADVTIYGKAADDRTGRSVGAGDVNGDGVSDVLIGATQANPRVRADAGSAYVIFGDPSWITGTVIDLAAAPADVTIDGARPGDQAGRTVYVGDFDGDGAGDLIVGAYRADVDGRTDAGAVYLLRGPMGSSAPMTVDLLTDPVDVMVKGAAPGEGLGLGVNTGDLDGDGKQELLAGAWMANAGPARADAGNLFVIKGRAVPPGGLVFDLSTTPADLTILGEQASDFTGHTPLGADLDCDGLDDITLSGYSADPNGRIDAGKSYTLLGSGLSLNGSTWDLASTASDVEIEGAHAGDITGFSLARGDINGDGRQDLLVGGPWVDHGSAIDAGAMYGFLGGGAIAGNPTMDLATFAPDLLMNSTVQNERLAESIASGDHNGDGIDDLLISAPRANAPGGVEAGRILVVNGRPTDSDFDARVNNQDDCPIQFNPGQEDLDQDGLGDVCDLDDDNDGAPDAADCAPHDALVTSEPSDVQDLRFDADGQTLRWSPPAASGGSVVVRYDVLVSDRTMGFPGASCEESDDASDTEAVSVRIPAPGKALYYLVRAENLCGGRLGANSLGHERSGRNCP